MCAPSRSARCVDAESARKWWGSPVLFARDSDRGQFILQHQDGRFAHGDAKRYVPSSLVLVLTFGDVTPRHANQPEVLNAGGVVVLAIRTTSLQEPVHDRPVRIRGHVATYGEATSITTRAKYRYVQWSVKDGAHFIQWSVIDDPTLRSLDELVHLVEALGEA